MKNKKIILAITGSIAAYKCATLVRLFVKAGAEVRVLMTKSATDFISPLTLSTLSKNAVVTDIHSENAWNNHVELGLWADVFIIAPVTATTLGKLAQGISDNAVVATYLSARCPVFFAPAMDVDMWLHPATKRNVDTLIKDGCSLIPVESGELASGLNGLGRMSEPEHIFETIQTHFSIKEAVGNKLAGKKIIVTSGPTQEAIDPVRYIGNRSSGKMGNAIALALANAGASVELISGPVKTYPEHANIHITRVTSAQQMCDAALKAFATSDGAILAAAVADFRPMNVADKKIKKTADNTMSITLEKTPDIAQTLGQLKNKNQMLVGFALETDNALANAQLKRVKKNFDFIVLNSLEKLGAGFEHDTNIVTLVFDETRVIELPIKQKTEIAQDLLVYIVEFFNQKR